MAEAMPDVGAGEVPGHRPASRLTSVNGFSVTFWVTVVVGTGVLVAAAREMTTSGPVARPAALAVLTALVVFGELRPVVTSRSYGEGVTPSIAFTFAIMYLWGPWPALLAQGLASVVADVAARKEWWRTLFNPAQYAISFLAAWGVMVAAGYQAVPTAVGSISAGDLLPMALAWVVYFLVNNAVVSAVLATYSGESLRALFFEDFGYVVVSNFSVFVVSPLVAVGVGMSVWWVALVLPPLFAVYRTSAMSLEKEHQANHDALTGLPNRVLLLDRLGRALADRREGRVALFLLDLDRFKEVNDTLGHLMGDRLLIHVAERIRAAVRPSDVVARLGGDEFAVVLPAVPDAEAAAEVAERIRVAVAEPFAFEGLLLELEASVGIALCPDHGTDVQQLQRSADVAMYLAKEERSGVEVYSAAKDRHSTTRLGLLGELRQAIEGGQLELHYQPKVGLGSGAPVGVEALVRWRHPHRGLILPDEFVPLAEHSGLMNRLTEFVVDTALAQAAQWWEIGLQVPVAVNVSARDLHGPSLTTTVARGLERHGLPASALLLELTERVLMAESARVGDTLAALERLGVRLSLDDFGTGYSSMVMLRRLPVREIKIERLFVQRLAQSGEDATIVRSIVDLAHALGIQAVAEGVENEITWDLLDDLGCDSAQGWYVGRPMPADRATAWLLRHPSQARNLRVLRGGSVGGSA
ncbi:MAG: EAL domain-containing protein [Actinomycetia bacterium]|nr:EAL domain-containing protein [Actinomycetes bacterium]